MKNRKQFIAIFFFEHRSPVRYHCINLLSLSQFVQSKYGNWSAVNVYNSERFFCRQFKNCEYLPARLYDFFNH